MSLPIYLLPDCESSSNIFCNCCLAAGDGLVTLQDQFSQCLLVLAEVAHPDNNLGLELGSLPSSHKAFGLPMAAP